MKRTKLKAYALHDSVYRDLRAKNLRHWSDKPNPVPSPVRDGIETHDERFLDDVLAQDWAPKGGTAIELGCGSAPMLRWLWRRGFRGLGVDVSPAAIRMAREQSRGCKGLRFQRADVIRDALGKAGTYDLALDGCWLHCVTERTDRDLALAQVRRLLRKGGVFIVLTMCAPVRVKRFASLYPNQVLRNHIVYAFSAGAERYDGSRNVGGRACLPTRYISYWRDILREIQSAGLEPRLIRLNKAFGDEVSGSLCVASIAV